ncbi:MAG: ABC transporter permease [Chlamydiae bacterium]|nr:ABC transporter permease [Chlamydiota bacterium]
MLYSKVKSFSAVTNFSIVLLTFLFLYTPIVVLFIFSFNSKAFPAPWDSFTLYWYHELFQSTELWLSFKNSLIVATLSTLLSLTMGMLLIFFRTSGGNIHKFLPMFYGTLVIPETVLAVSLLAFFSLFSIPLGLPTIVASHTVLGLGFVIPVVYTRYLELDPKLQEASLILGASPTQTFFRITLPLLRPALLATGLLIFIISFDDFILTYFCSGTAFQTLSIYLFTTIRSGISPIVNALSVFLLALTSLLVMCFFSPKIRTRIF